MISLQDFASCIGCTFMTAEKWHAPFVDAMFEFGVQSRSQTAYFLAQVGHESASLSVVEEDLRYSAQRLMAVWPKRFPTISSAKFYEYMPERLANLVYSGRMGNGSFESGDGYRYRGRGPIQITGADTYRKCGAALNVALIEKPEVLTDPKQGARSAAWFWIDHKCNQFADQGDLLAITKAINGGTNGLEDRMKRTEHALKVMN